MKLIKITAALLACIMLICSCSNAKAPSLTLKYDLGASPDTLDPQYAKSGESLSVIKNIFEGLTAISETGEVVAACAESWSVSDDGLCYTFVLRDDLHWANGDSIIAADFEFAMRRIFNPNAFSPSAEDYLMIKNAQKILEGELAAEALGVAAKSERELVITLERDDPSLLMVLSMAAASPCQEKFFSEQKGRYGLTAKNLLCNGPFLADRWNENVIVLNKNEQHRKVPQVEHINMYIGRGDAVELFTQGKSDVALVPFQNFSQAQKLNGETFYDQSWLLLLNYSNGVLAQRDIRAAMVSALDIEGLRKSLPEHLMKYDGVIAPSAMFGGKFYRDFVSQPTPAKRVSEPKKVFWDALDRLEQKDIGRLQLLVSSFEPGPQLGGEFQRQWQQKLSAFINMEQLEYSQLIKRTSNGDFDIAIVPLVSQSGSPIDFMSPFERVDSQYAQENEDGLLLPDLISGARQQTFASAAAAHLFLAEQKLIDDFIAVPLFAAPSLFAVREGVSGVYYDTVTRTVYFADAQCVSK